MHQSHFVTSGERNEIPLLILQRYVKVLGQGSRPLSLRKCFLTGESLNLMSEIAGGITADAKEIRAKIDSGDNEGATAIAEGTLKRKVEIDEIDMRGGGDDIIIRASYTVHGPDTPKAAVGYFRFSHSPITGWRYRRETTALSWYLKVI